MRIIIDGKDLEKLINLMNPVMNVLRRIDIRDDHVEITYSPRMTIGNYTERVNFQRLE